MMIPKHPPEVIKSVWERTLSSNIADIAIRTLREREGGRERGREGGRGRGRERRRRRRGKKTILRGWTIASSCY